MQGRDEDARLGLDFETRPLFARCHACRQRQERDLVAEVSPPHEHAVGIGLCLDMFPGHFDEQSQDG